MPSGDCETVECSQILDSNNNPYQCRPEKEALHWHKKCLEQDDKLCRYNGNLKYIKVVKIFKSSYKESMHVVAIK